MNHQELSRKFPKVLAAAVSAAVMATLAGAGHAGTTIVFSDNTSPISPFPAIDAANTSPLSDRCTSSGCEFRVIVGGNISGGGSKSITPTATWIFNNSNQMSAVQNTQTTPGASLYGAKGPDGQPGTADDIASADANGGPGLFQNALFLGENFGFLAPTTTSPAGLAYGPATVTISGSTLTVFIPTAEAQWNEGAFLLGNFNNRGVTFSGPIAANDHSFRMTAAHTIAPYEDSLGFASQETQWDLVGVVNSDPAANTTSYSTDPATPLVIPVADIATDREGDTLSITSANPAVAGSAGGTVSCTASVCTYTPGGAGTANFTVTVVDNFSTQGSASIPLTVLATTDAVANADSATVDQNSSGNSIDLAANDTDADGTIDLATIAIATAPANGTIDSIPGDGTVVYTPDAGFVGTDTFTYTIDDNGGNTSVPATVTITVNATTPSTAAGAVTAGSIGSTTVTLSQLLSAGIPRDDAVQNPCNPDCFDFVAPTSGGNAVVVLPLSGALPSSALYRKYINGAWTTFDTSAGDTVKSAPGSLGSCPPPGDASYVPGLAAGDFCIELTIADGGPNDADTTAGQVTDPSGPGNGDPDTVVRPAQSLGGGCVLSGSGTAAQRLDLWLLAALLGLFGMRRVLHKH